MSGHSVIAPSSLHRIRVCPASVSMQKPYAHLPWGDPEASEEGTCAHWVLATLLVTGVMVPVGAVDPAGTPVTDEMIEGAEMALEAVDTLLAKYGATRADLIVEQPVQIPRVHPECWGTPDIRFRAPGKVLVVLDYKFGYRYVTEFENDQLMAYAVGDLTGEQDQEWRVVMGIIQPRAYGSSAVRTWEANASSLRGHINVLATAAVEALGPEPRARATPDGCRDCRARHACPTLQQAAQWAMDYASRPQPVDLSPAALSTELRFAERQLGLLEARVEGMKAQALYLARTGQALPHHTTGTGRGRKVWAIPDDQVIALGKAMNVDLAKAPAAVTPSQAVRAGLNPALLSGLSRDMSGEVRLVPFDNSTTRKIFGK